MPNGGLEYRSKEEWQKWEEPLIILDKNVKKIRKLRRFKERMRDYHNWPSRTYMWHNKNGLVCNFYIGLAKDEKTYEIIISASKRKIFYWFGKGQTLVDHLMSPINVEELISYFKKAVSILDSWNIQDLEREALNKKKIILKIAIIIVWVVFMITWLSLVLNTKI